MKQIVLGILAHVDSGKTTLSEAMLYKTGSIRSYGRVDHGNAFLDANEIEREKGITIFSSRAVMKICDTSVTLLDTPGHIDFSTETERALSVLDYCILVVSGTDGVESHTQTLWKLLERYNIPTFIFVNKMDISQKSKAELMHDIHKNLSENCIELADADSLILCDEQLLDEYESGGTITQKTVSRAIMRRNVFPCFFGSALKMQGVDEFLSALSEYTCASEPISELGGRIFKISWDSDGTRLTHIKITGGSLRAKSVLTVTDPDGNIKNEKVDTIRIYQGEKYTLTDSAQQGMICAVTGLNSTVAGMGIGFEENSKAPVLEPVMTYKVEILDGTDVHTALMKLKILQDEDPLLHIDYSELLRQINIQLMGQVQIDILRRVIRERFNISVDFSEGAISYRETIADTVEGVGHFEPLRHYSEVHLILEPQKRGSGIVIATDCSEDLLDKNWQRLILTHIKEKTHIGVLTGSPVTDIKITLASGKAHKKHTEGGDFRQATYRAIRNGLMHAQSILLEPYYDFKLSVPTQNVGRAMTDLSQMGAEFSSPTTNDDMSIISGSAPVCDIRTYHTTLASYTSGKGRLTTSFKGYLPCHNTDEVVASIGYNPDSDTENPASSVFCEHGSGFNVPWDKVKEYMHLESALKPQTDITDTPISVKEYVSGVINDEELLRIFEKTYGPIKRKAYNVLKTPAKEKQPKPQRYIKPKAQLSGKTYLLVDGYNIIFAWDDLKKAAEDSLDLARELLINRLCNYCGYAQCELILVFDAYKVKGGIGSVEKVNNINVVYTKEAETADSYIERVTHELSKKHRVRVATSDGLEQIIILGSGAERVSASAFLEEVTDAEQKIRDFITSLD